MDEQTQHTNGGGTTDKKEQVKQAMNGLEAMLAPMFANLPHIPDNGRKVIVDIAPWIVLIFGILGVVGLLGLGGMGMGVSLMSYGNMGLSMLIHVAVGLLSTGLLLMSYPGIKAKTKAGWNLVFYSEVVSVAGGVIGLAMWGSSNIVGVIIGALIGFYILFEVRSHYN